MRLISVRFSPHLHVTVCYVDVYYQLSIHDRPANEAVPSLHINI